MQHRKSRSLLNLGLTEVVSLFEDTLDEEKAADENLSEVAADTINIEAVQEEP